MATGFDFQPHLVGELLEVRPLRKDDYEGLRVAASDPLIWDQHPLKRHREEIFRPYFAEHLASGGAVVVTDRESNRIVGTSRYHGYEPERSEVEIGWTFLARSHWGGVYNAELKTLMLAHAFRYVEIVVFLVHPDNHRSQRAMEKIGGVRAGTRSDGSRKDYVCFEITRR
jgi:RimJ/RimL family protein N-acetyltransferase